MPGGAVSDPLSNKALEKVAELAPEVYKDLAQPAVQEVGKVLSGATRIGLSPLRGMIWTWEFAEQRLSEAVKKRLGATPEAKRLPAPAVVVGPAIEAYRYAGSDPDLADLFSSLVAASMNGDLVQYAHPAFVEILKQLAPDEARVMRLFVRKSAFPLVDVIAYNESTRGALVVARNVTLLPELAACDIPTNGPVYVDNLGRLGLLEILDRRLMDVEQEYQAVEHSALAAPFVQHAKDQERTPRFERRTIKPTELGDYFLEACVGFPDSGGGGGAASDAV